MTDTKLKDLFLGKKISLINNAVKVVGVCDFIGHNEYFPSWGLQVTIERMPIINVNYTKIKIVTNV